MTHEQDAFERALGAAEPRPMEAAHREATLRRTRAARPAGRTRTARETRHLVAAAAAVALLFLARGMAAASLERAADVPQQPVTHEAEVWARYVEAVRAKVPVDSWDADDPGEATPTAPTPPRTSRLDPRMGWA